MEDKIFHDLVYQLRAIKLTESQTKGMKLAVAVKQRKDLAAKRDPNPELTIVIEDILAKHREDDMEEFLDKRECLNYVNGWLNRLFDLFQLAGIMMTSYAVAHGSTTLVWIGVILNSVASVIQIYIKINDELLKQMMSDLQIIKEGIQSVPSTVPTEDEQCIVPYEDVANDDEDPDLKALIASMGIIDKHKNDLKVELICRLNTIEDKSESNGQQLESEGIRSEMDSLSQVHPRAVTVSTPSLPPYSYPYTVQRDYCPSKGSKPSVM